MLPNVTSNDFLRGESSSFRDSVAPESFEAGYGRRSRAPTPNMRSSNTVSSNPNSGMEPNAGNPRAQRVTSNARYSMQNSSRSPPRLRSDGALVASRTPSQNLGADLDAELNSSSSKKPLRLAKRLPDPDRFHAYVPFTSPAEYFKSKIEEIESMRDAAYSLSDYPDSDEGEVRLVQAIVDAILDTNSAADGNCISSFTGEVDKARAIQAFENGAYSERELYNAAWELLVSRFPTTYTYKMNA